MTRSARLHFKNARYHVMLRGNYRQSIFNEKSDYLKMLDQMEIVTKKFHCNIMTFCLMTNHIHMVLQVKDIPLSKIMQSLASRYAGFYNKKMEAIGHLFQGRYLAKLILNDDYLLQLCYYIHNNPRAAKMCKDLDNYPWSSHRHYSGIESINWLYSDEIINLLQIRFPSHDNFYDKFLSVYQNEISDSPCDFDSEMCLTIAGNDVSHNTIMKAMNLSCYSIQEISEIVCTHLNVSLPSVRDMNLNRKVALARGLIAYFAHYHAGYQLKQIAILFNQKPDSVSLNSHKTLMREENKTIQEELYMLFSQLSKVRKPISDPES